MSTKHHYLEKLAFHAGIEPGYLDNWGNTRLTPITTKKKILQIMGFHARSEEAAKQILETALAQKYERLAEPAIIAEIHQLPMNLPFRTGKDTDGLESDKPFVTLAVTTEEGETTESEFSNDEVTYTGTEKVGEVVYQFWSIPFPELIRLGYYQFRLSVACSGCHETQKILVAVCPKKAFLPDVLGPGKKTAGIFVSLYSVRSERNWGIGDFGDLKELIRWVSSELKGSVIGLNPLHAIFNRSPFNTSPYLPVSKFYRNFIYLDIPAIEDYPGSKAEEMVKSPDIDKKLHKLRKADKVCYEDVASIKTEALRLVFEHFLEKHWNGKAPLTKRGNALKSFVEKEGALLKNFATFCALDTVIRSRDPEIWIWPQWPEEYQRNHSEAVTTFQAENWKEILFQQYLQWQIEAQLKSAQEYAKKRGMAIGLYHDLALAVDRYGADCWAYPDHFIPDTSVGAPPDAFSQHGQDWGFPSPCVETFRKTGYELFIQEIRKNCAYGGALRIDHVMRLFHLYLIPANCSPEQGAYVSQYWEDLVRLLTLESVRTGVVIVGEDLGTVPEYIRKHLEAAGILSYRLLYFEKESSGHFIKPSDYPEMALVTITTHDLPTLSGFWSLRDMNVRKKAGLFQNELSYMEACKARETDKERLVELMVETGLIEPQSSAGSELTGELHNAIVGMVALTPSKLFILNQEDLFKEHDQQNLPGTTNQYPNWSLKMKYSIEELLSRRDTKKFGAMFRHWVEKSGRMIE